MKEQVQKHIRIVIPSVLTRVQQVGIFISKNFIGQEVVSVSIERHEWHHVVTIIVANRGIGTGVAGPGRLVGPKPALKDTGDVVMKS